MLFRVMYRSHSYLEIKNFKSPVYQFTKVSRLLDPRLFDYTNIRLHEFPRQRTTENRKHLLSSRGKRSDELARPTKAGDLSFLNNLKILHSAIAPIRMTSNFLPTDYTTTPLYNYTKNCQLKTVNS
jgi:hypothetical protein